MAEPPPVIPEPVIRRVGVVPDPPASRTDPDPPFAAGSIMAPRQRYTVNPDAELPTGTGSARTETLPAVPDDIFATFSGPDPTPTLHPIMEAVAPAEDPLAHLRTDPEPRRRQRGRPDARTLLIGAAGVLVVGLIALLAVISSGGAGSTANRPKGINGSTATPKPSTGSVTAMSFGGSAPPQLTRIGSSTAATLLTKAGVAGGGVVHEAWTWKDDNGNNLVVTLIKPGSSSRHKTLQVIHLAHLETSDPTVLRRMNDPNLPTCPGGGIAGFTKGGLVVRDLNRDGVAEVAVGWSSTCAAAKTSEVKLALITGHEKFIVRGRGEVGGTGTAVPAPARSSWPAGYLQALTAVFHRLYY